MVIANPFPVFGMEYRTAGYKDIRAGCYCRWCCFKGDPAVHFKLAAGIVRIYDLPHLFDDIELRAYERLSPQSGINGHYQDKVNMFNERQNGIGICAGTERDARLFPACPYNGEGLENFFRAVGLHMAVYQIGACVAEPFDIP